MTVSVTERARTDGFALLERAMGYTLGGLVLVRPEDMAARTPCAAWDLRTLLLHMNHSLLTLHQAVAAGHLDLAAAGNPEGDYGDPAVDPVASLRNRACRMIGAWAGSDGPAEITIADRRLVAGVVAATGAVEVAVHGWDVARACGDPRPLPDELAHDLLGHAELLVTDDDRGVRFGPPLPVGFDRPPSDRLLALTGRSPDWGP
jgi:uncharacterized protein (TIGR03086 family)